ncbi:MAG: hypothetical protein IM638_14430 [Bacteroidetes bacterium]|nr:hypothetical protein [Bacteroidota bacterium]
MHIEQRKYRKGWYVSNTNRSKVSEKVSPNTAITDINSDEKTAATEALVKTVTASENIIAENTDSATACEQNSCMPPQAGSDNQTAKTENNNRNVSDTKQVQAEESKRSILSSKMPVNRYPHIPTLDETRNIAASIHPAVKIAVGLVLITVVTFFLLLATPFLWFFSFLLGLALLIAGIIDLVQRHRGTHTPEKAARNLRGSLVAMIALGAVMVAVFLVLLVLMPFIILSEFV